MKSSPPLTLKMLHRVRVLVMLLLLLPGCGLLLLGDTPQWNRFRELEAPETMEPSSFEGLPFKVNQVRASKGFDILLELTILSDINLRIVPSETTMCLPDTDKYSVTAELVRVKAGSHSRVLSAERAGQRWTMHETLFRMGWLKPGQQLEPLEDVFVGAGHRVSLTFAFPVAWKKDLEDPQVTIVVNADCSNAEYRLRYRIPTTR